MIIPCLRRLRHAEHGAELVEFALVLPVFVLMLLGFMECARGVFSYSSLANATYEGARYAVLKPTDTTGIKNSVVSAAVGVQMSPNEVTVTCNPCTSGKMITVAVVHTHLSVVSNMFPNLSLTTSVSMEIE